MSISKINNDLEVVVSDLMQNNTYLIYHGKDVLIIDPSFAGDEIIEHLNNKYSVAGILLTHAHFDHTFDTAKLIKKYGCPVYILDKEKETYQLYDCSDWFNREVPDFESSLNYIKEGNFKVRDFNLEIVHTGGHTAGGMTIFYKNYVFVGDTLFYDSYGRTDLYNSSQIEMKKSIAKLFKLIKNDQVVLPGHGQWATFKEVKDTNLIAQDLLIR